jgi:hypothetical protein
MSPGDYRTKPPVYWPWFPSSAGVRTSGTEKIMQASIVIQLQTALNGYFWQVPRPDNGVEPVRFAEDIGTAVRAALARTKDLYGTHLGEVNFRLNPGF